MAQSCTRFRRAGKQHFECVRQAHRRLQGWFRRLNLADIRVERRLYTGELPDLPDSSVLILPPAIDYGPS